MRYNEPVTWVCTALFDRVNDQAIGESLRIAFLGTGSGAPS
jgi:hypothetical protein